MFDLQWPPILCRDWQFDRIIFDFTGKHSGQFTFDRQTQGLLPAT
jgi:hypothetical protein